MNNLEPATESPNGNRWCTNCEQARSSHGGFWKMNENKKNRRWICKTCGERRIKQNAPQN